MPLSTAKLPPQFLMPLLFLTNGIFLGMWVASIPDITSAIGMDHATTGRVLSMVSLGGLLSFPLVAIAVRRAGSRAVLLGFGVLRVATFLLLALASSDVGLAAALVVVGFAHGGLDVALNNQAVEMEHAHGISLLPRAHAAYSIGTLSGSLGAGVLEGAGMPITLLFVAPVIFGALVFGTARNGLVSGIRRTSAEAIPASKPIRKRQWSSVPIPSFPLMVLLAIAVISEIGDEAISDWYSIYLREDLHSLPAVSSMDYSVFSLGILLGRILGDPLIRNTTSARVLQMCGAVSGLGMLIGLAGNTTPMMVLGTFITGLGFSLLLPTLYREAGSLPNVASATAMSMMATALYLGFMIGPLIIGPFSNVTSLRFALMLVGLMFFAIPVLGQLLTRTEPARAKLLPR